jgi:hypothetical protein
MKLAPTAATSRPAHLTGIDLMAYVSSTRMRSAALLFAFVSAAVPNTVAATETKTLRLGRLELWYDAERWRETAAGENTVTMEPVGVLAGRRNPVRVTRAEASGESACEKLAQRELPDDMYGEPSSGTVEIGGVTALQLTAHTRCRNAMPTGVVVCMQAGDSAYLFTDTRPSCRSGANNIFSDVDPFAELLDGVQIAE